MNGPRCLALVTGSAAILTLSACATPGPGDTAASAALLDEHVRSTAMAHCLRSVGGKGLPAAQAEVLREEGQRWVQILVEKSRGDIELLFAIMPAVDAALAAAPVALIHDDSTGGTLPAAVFHCDTLLREPGVERAMAEARRRLAPAYVEE